MKRCYYLAINIVLDYESNPELGPDHVRTQLQRFVNDGTVSDFEEYDDWREGGQTVFEVSLRDSGPMSGEFKRWLDDICDGEE